ncbi:hypothetical protein [Leifsonia sp. P73]|uniref:hypothetical protein n=1 Tax=Leifsonia sp. P73 TaxID=3423959 RepID=UPI003DA27870
MTAYAGYPDGVRGIESVVSPVDVTEIQATCPCEDCDFDGDVEAECWLLIPGTTERTFEFRWTCPFCENETVEERVFVDGDDS